MKVLSTVIIITCINLTLVGQTVIEDALKFKNMVIGNDTVLNTQMTAILLPYFFDTLRTEEKKAYEDFVSFQNKKKSSNERNTDSTIITQNFKTHKAQILSKLNFALDKNPFLAQFNFNNSKDEKFLLSATNTLNQFAGADVTNIADGLARFMVSRAKTEINTAFFAKFQEQMESFVELQILFPQTAKLLHNIGKDIYKYNAYITSLRAAFEIDLSNQLENLPKLLDDEKYYEAFNQIPELRVILKSSLLVVDQLARKKHPGNILHDFPKRIGRDVIPDSWYNPIRLVDIFSQSLRSSDTTGYWANRDTLSKLQDSLTLRIYLGLLYQKIPKDLELKYGSDSINVKKQFYKLGVNFSAKSRQCDSIRGFILEFGEKANTVSRNIEKLRINKQQANYREIHAFLSSSLELFEYAKEIDKLPYINRKNLLSNFSEIDRYLFVASNASDLYLNINERNYGSGILNVTNILDTLFTDTILCNDRLLDTNRKELNELNDQIKGIESGIKESSGQEKENLKTELKELQDEKLVVNSKGRTLLEQKKNAQLILKNFSKYGTLMATIVDAKNSEEVEAAIESAALPAGSYRIKRESRFNISINSYLGGFVGYEIVPGGTNNGSLNNLALTAPIGIAFSWGAPFKNHNKIIKPSKKNNSNNGALSIFMSVIDIGAIVSFRFDDDSSQTISKVELQNIFSPGVSLNYGFPKLPITLGLGAQIGPLLRKVEAKENTVADNYYWRIGASVTIDIPLFNLYTTERNRKFNLTRKEKREFK